MGWVRPASNKVVPHTVTQMHDNDRAECMIFSSECIMAKTMSKRSMPKRTAKKERKGKKSTRGYRKGSKSKTMKGKKDFTTKKTSKVFNRRKHYQKHAKGSRVIRRPYAKKGGALKPEEHQPTGTCNFEKITKWNLSPY